jgi:hypothetical protein
MLTALLLFATQLTISPVEDDPPRIESAKPDRSGSAAVPSKVVSGRVMASDHSPVAAFEIALGPGQFPSASNSVVREVQDAKGRFNVIVPTAGLLWVGVVAEGFAPWEGRLLVGNGGREFDIHMTKGVTVAGVLAVPDELKRRVTATLFPRRDKVGYGGVTMRPLVEKILSRQASVHPDGILRFEHVLPDRYKLIVRLDGITKAVLALDVPDAGLDLGSIRLDLTTDTGRVEGRAWLPKSIDGGVWAFAKGYIEPPQVGGDHGVDPFDDRYPLGKDAIEFQADENGKFHVDRVPVGLVTVGFSYMPFDAAKVFKWSALIMKGGTTVVHAFDPDVRQDYTLTLAIGDGSQEQYESGVGQRLEPTKGDRNVTSRSNTTSENNDRRTRGPAFGTVLFPLSKGSLSFPQADWLRLDADKKVVLNGVSPASYRLMLYDLHAFHDSPWSRFGWSGVEDERLFDGRIVAAPGARNETQIPLGAGCIRGRPIAPDAAEGTDRSGVVVAMPSLPDRRSRRAPVGYDGTFCIRYMPPGKCSLYIHIPSCGYRRIEQVVVPAGVIDLGEQRLTPGATVIGTIHFPRVSRQPTELVASDAVGVTLRHPFRETSSYDSFDLGGIWPGRWTLSALSHGEVVATSTIDVRANGTYHTTLVAKGVQDR